MVRIRCDTRKPSLRPVQKRLPVVDAGGRKRCPAWFCWFDNPAAVNILQGLASKASSIRKDRDGQI